MKERPILFTGEMVRAILEGKKTQTRRVIKPQPPSWINQFGYTFFTPKGHISGRGYWKGVPGDECPGENFFKIPYGLVGDRLWVREAWRVGAWNMSDGTVAIDYKASPELTKTPWIEVPEFGPDRWGNQFMELIEDVCDELETNGTKTDSEGEYHWEPGQAPLHWRPSIYMPRWSSRITLEITGIRVERVQEINEKDSLAEGVVEGFMALDTVSKYAFLWNSINEKRGYGWVINPWVWVVEFQVVK